VINLCTDAGSDEVAAGKLMQCETLPRLGVLWLFISTFCFMHQANLAICRQLKLQGLMFNMLAKIVNVYRSMGKPTAFKRSFVAKGLGYITKSMPVRAIRDRWGSVDKSAMWFYKAGRDNFRAAWREVIGEFHVEEERKTTATEESADPLVDELKEEYKVRMGRWAKDRHTCCFY